MNRKACFASIAALSLLASAPAALAKTQDGQSTSETAASGGKEERKICKRFDNSASRMKSTRLCLTKAEWKKFEATN